MIGMTIGYLVFTAVVWCFIGQELRHAPTKREWQGKETDTEIQTDNRPEKDAYPPQNAKMLFNVNFDRFFIGANDF